MSSSALYSFDFYQGHFGKIYGVTNDRIHSTLDLAVILLQSTTFLLKSVRKEKVEKVSMGVVKSFGFAIAVANRLHISLDVELLYHFPHVCPYCAKAPCDRRAHNRALGRKDLSDFRNGLVPESLASIQKILATIYPENTLTDSAQHLVEEVAELIIAIHVNRHMHSSNQSDQDNFDQVILELVDVIANVCAVATCANLDLSSLVEKTFGAGCPRCQRPVCECSFSQII